MTAENYAKKLILPNHELIRRPPETGYAIDPDNPIEVDDAISAEYHDGLYLVKVHIADGGLLTEHPELVDHARNKGWSVYDIADSNISTCDPMLPKSLSRDMLSLDIDHFGLGSPAVTVKFEINAKNAEISNFDVYKSRVVDCQTYNHKGFLEAYLRGDEPARQVAAVSGLLKKNYRLNSGTVKNDTLADQTVREYMLITNALIGKEMQSHGIPWIFRTFSIVKNRRSDYSIARYSSQPMPHEALALDLYSHFTSPLRRFPDLVNHLNLQAVLEHRTIPFDLAEITAIGDELHRKRILGSIATGRFAA